MRQSNIERKTKETDIKIELNIDGTGKSKIESKIAFLNNMIETYARFGNFDLKMKIIGDLEVDQHHTVEDTGIMLGKAFKKALGKKERINRAGYFVYPMDEALAVVAIDISGRPYLQYDTEFKRRFCGELDTDTLEDFFYGFSIGLNANVVVRMPYGRSDHHKIEAIFKAFGKTMKIACTIDDRITGTLSTKGVIDDIDN